MSFLNPIALWGLLALSIPILIHLWNGKRGKTIAWAAMDFLAEAENRVSKGLKLENLLVLVLRIVLISLLVLLLAQLYWLGRAGVQDKKIGHVLTGDKVIWEEFRFEIQQALEREETVILASIPPTEIFSLDELFEMENGFNLDLQLALDQLPEDLDSLIVYLPNSKLALDQDFYSSPVLPEIRLGELSTETTPSQFLKTKSNRFFAINDNGVLDTISRAANEYVEFDFSKKSIPFLINNSTSESRYINAALESISEIYGFDFQQTENLDSAELIFSENLPQIFYQKKLYFISNSRVYPEFENQIVLEDSLVFSQSELIRKGRLPEFLLEKFLKHIGFKEKSSAIDLVQLEKRFLTKGKNSSTQKANLNEWLMILLLGTLVIERYLSNKQGI